VGKSEETRTPAENAEREGAQTGEGANVYSRGKHIHSSHWRAFPGSYDSQIGINLGSENHPMAEGLYSPAGSMEVWPRPTSDIHRN
jgi:hypothetical protein